MGGGGGGRVGAAVLGGGLLYFFRWGADRGGLIGAPFSTLAPGRHEQTPPHIGPIPWPLITQSWSTSWIESGQTRGGSRKVGWGGGQRRSQVSLVGGANKIPGGLTEFQGGNKPQYLHL